jgi:autotransporter-associated beta strand protein
MAVGYHPIVGRERGARCLVRYNAIHAHTQLSRMTTLNKRSSAPAGTHRSAWRRVFCSLGLLTGGMLLLEAPAQGQSLGAASTFSVLGGSTVTNTGPTILIGNLGVSPGSAITGFPPGSVTGTIYVGAASLAGTAHADTVTAYGIIQGMAMNTNLTGQDLGGMTLTPGVYRFDTSAQLTGNLFLNPLGNSNSAFYFQIGTTLTTADFSSLTVVGGLQLANIFWQVGSSATLGIGSALAGNILASQSITLTTGASLSSGRALAINGGVTLDSNNINNGGPVGAPIGINGIYWKGGISNLWSEMNWSPDITGAANQNLPALGANVIFSVTGVTPAHQNTMLDTNQSIDSLTVNDSAVVSISGPNTLTISGSGLVTGIRVNNGAGLVTIGSNLVLAGASQTISVNNTAGMLITGVVGGTIGLTKTGLSQLTLTGENVYTGPTNINTGTLQVGNGLSGSILAGSLVTVAPGANLLLDLVNGGMWSNAVVNNGQIQWIAPGNNAQTAASVISGGGSMLITSPGNTVLAGSNTFSGGTTINTPGNVLVSNPFGNTSTTFGTGTLDIKQGNVDTLGGQLLQINVGGYVQSGGQISMHLQGTTPGTYTQYNVLGTATLTGGTVFVYDDSGLYVPTGASAGNPGGDRQTIIQTTGGLTGQNFLYHEGDTLLYPTVTYDANNAYITWVQAPFTSVPGLTPNQVATAGGLDGFQFLNPGNPAITYLNGQPVSQLPGLYNQIAPDELTAIFQMGFHAAEIQGASIQQHLQQVRDGARRNSGDMSRDTIASSANGGTASSTVTEPYERRWNFFVEGLGGSATVSTTSNASGYNFNTIGTMMGADYLVNEHFAFGGMGGYTRSNASLVNGGSIQADSFRSAVYATLFGGGFYLDGQTGLTYSSYDTNRSSLLGNAIGNTSGVAFNSQITGGYDHHVGDLTMGVFTSLAYTRVNFDKFTETGSLTPLSYPNQYQQSLRSNIGVRFGYTTQLGRMRLTPQVRASWQHEFMDSTQSIASSFSTGPGPVFNVNGPAIGRDSLRLSTGLLLQITPTVGAYLFYGGQLGRANYISHSVTLGMNISF